MHQTKKHQRRFLNCGVRSPDPATYQGFRASNLTLDSLSHPQSQTLAELQILWVARGSISWSTSQDPTQNMMGSLWNPGTLDNPRKCLGFANLAIFLCQERYFALQRWLNLLGKECEAAKNLSTLSCSNGLAFGKGTWWGQPWWLVTLLLCICVVNSFLIGSIAPLPAMEFVGLSYFIFLRTLLTGTSDCLLIVSLILLSLIWTQIA